MANGNGNTALLTPAKTISICVAITIAINGWSLATTQEHAEELAELRREVALKTDKRYRVTDAERDFRLVYYRLERDEADIDRCIKFIDKHHKLDEHK